MVQPAPSNDRLPWLTEVPRIGPAAQPGRRWQFPWGAVLIGLAFAFVAVAAYYLGIRRATTSQEVAGTQSIPLDQPYEATEPAPASTTVPPAEPSAEVSSPASPEASSATAPPPRITERRSSARQAAPQPRLVQRRRPRATTSPAQAEDEAPVIVQPEVRGRIIQLGAYPTQAQAEVAWQKLVKKWPYLATKPRLVSPIDVRSTDGKATRMHRLQLATASQAQSVVICQQLERTRQSCVVVY